MAQSGYSRIVQQDLSGGMFPSLAPELIPPNGAFDITNGLLDEENVVYRRGGSSYMASTPTAPPRLLWSGYLTNGGQQTLLYAGGQLLRVTTGAVTVVANTFAPLSVMTRAQVYKGILYVPMGKFDGTTWTGAGETFPFYATAGNRLVRARGAKIEVSKIEDPTFEATNYLELPGGVTITGMEGLRTACAVFTNEGVWVITGLALNLTDAEGNVQWKMDRYSTNIELWGNAGVAGWSGELVVPAKDAVYLMNLGVSSERSPPFRAISGAITNVYRGYVNAGYTPGVAAVYRAHYFLPIMSGESIVDCLVCRLDGGKVGRSGERGAPPWTRIKGYGAQVGAFAVTDQEAAFLGATAGVGRVLKLSYFQPSSTATMDADGSAYPFEITTRDILTGSLTPNLVAKIRLSYRMAGNAESKLLMYFGSTPVGASWGEFNWGEADWTAVTGPFEQLSGEAPDDPAGTTPYVFQGGGRGRKVRYCRLKMALKGSVSSVSIRTLELFIRQDGRVI